MNRFSDYHPIVLFVYYIIVFGISMFTLHPVLLAGTCIGGIVYFSILNSRKTIISNLVFYFFLFVLIAITNPLFSHNGETILFFMNDKPITLEAILYGVAIACMLIGIMFWCKCYNLIMTSDKFVYLFGKAIPKMSLVLSMALRFVPVFRSQTKKISQVQKNMGIYSGDSITDRFFSSIRIFSSLLTWALENAVDTADSMKARGYGLKGRTNYSNFRFRLQDGILIAILLVGVAIFVSGYAVGFFQFYYYPTVSHISNTSNRMIQYVVVWILMIIPTIIELKGYIQWKLLKSKI